MRNDAPEKLIFYGLCFFAFAVIFSVTGVEAALFITLAGLIFKNYREKTLSWFRPALTGHPLFIPWMVYLGVCLLTAITAYYPAKGFGQLNSDFLKYLCLSTLLLAVKKEQLPRLSVFYAAGAALAALIGLGEVTRLLPADNLDMNRADAFMNSVRYGEVMGIAALFALSRTLLPGTASSNRERLFYYISAALIFTALIASRTRGAYLGTLAGAGMMLFAARVSWKRLAAILAALALVVVLYGQLAPHAYTRFMRTVETTKEILSPAPSQNVRPRLWRIGLKMFSDHPFLGVGPDNVKPLFPGYCPELILDQSWGSLHNIYIHQAAERGIAGLGALALLFWALFAFALRNFRARRTAATLWALCLLPAWYVMNLTEISLQHVHTSFAVFLALAFSAADANE